MPAKKKPAAKKPTTKKAAPKKPAVKKPAAKKPAATKKATRRKPATKKNLGLAIVEPMDEEIEVLLPRWDGKREFTSKAMKGYSRESDSAYRAFCDYCLMGPARSLTKLHKGYVEQAEILKLKREQKAKFGKGFALPEQRPPTTRLTTLKEWSTSFGWGRRTRPFDLFYGREQLRLYRAHLMQNVDVQMGIIKEGFSIVKLGMADLINTYKATGVFPAPFRDVVRLFDLSLKHYRLTLGLSTENIELGISPEGGLREETELDVSNQELEIIMATLTDALYLDEEREPEDDHDYSQYGSD